MNDHNPILPTPPSTPAPAEYGHGQDTLTPEQAAKMADWAKQDRASGRISPAQADQQFAELNTPIEQRGHDTRTDEQKQLDQHFPTAKPDEYLIAYGLGDGVPMSPEMKQFDQSARTWLSGAEFPRELGNSLITTISKVAQQTQAMTPEQLITYGEAEFAKLELVYGPALDDKLRAAGRMVEDLDKKTTGLKNLLKSKGIGDNALVASLLIQQSERYWARRKGR